MRHCFGIVVGILLAAWGAHGAVWHVDGDNASGVEDGLSWATAYTTLQPAIDAAGDAGGGTVWVAEGVYGGRTPLDLRSGVHILGGFSGSEEKAAKRDVEAHASVLDAGGYGRAFVADRIEAALLDGLTIRRGKAGRYPDYYGGGGRITYCTGVRIVNCIFEENASEYGGGGGGGLMVDRDSEDTAIEGCTFRNNSATSAGALLSLSSIRVYQCRFESNSAAGSGGAVYASTYGGKECESLFERCLFLGNSAGNYGGAVHASSYMMVYASDTVSVSPLTEQRNFPRFVNCLFSGNSAAMGGAISTMPSVEIDYEKNRSESASPPMLAQCTFVGNSAEEGGGVIYNYLLVSTYGYADSYSYSGECSYCGKDARRVGVLSRTAAAESPVAFRAENCIFWGNAADTMVIREVSNGSMAFPIVSSIIEGGYAGESNFDADPLFVDFDGGDYRLSADSPAIDAGAATWAPAEDLVGVPRPIGAGPDLGAYEYYASDTDGDGIPDEVEGDADPDEDGLGNFEDPDSDGDGIVDAEETVEDADGDGVANYLDEDSDGNGFSDASEGSGDTDHDGLADYLDPDNDGDGRQDWWEGGADSDADGLAAYADPDSDGDGVSDAAEKIVVYVDKGALSEDANGRTWTRALPTIQAGIDQAEANGGNAQVRVAAGLYDEDRSEHEGSIQMYDGVDLLGGYAPEGAAPRPRDPGLYETQLSTTSDERISALIVLASARIDGFIVRDFNTPLNGNGIFFGREVVVEIGQCLFEHTHTSGDGCIRVYNGDTLKVHDCVFSDCSGSRFGAIGSQATSLEAVRCIFRDCTESSAGGAGVAIDASSGSAVFDSCLFTSTNPSANGIEISTGYTTFLTILNSTFTRAGEGAYLSLEDFAAASVRNTIFAAQKAFSIEEEASLEMRYSCMPGGYAGEGNIAAAPGFVDAAGGDYRLAADSPCIDAGSLPLLLTYTDLAGAWRDQGAAPDMGAYESTALPDARFSSADLERDYKISLSELLRVIQLYNMDGYYCDAPGGESEDGYYPGAGETETCPYHTSDYNPADWVINLSELLRLIQLYNSPGGVYHAEEGTEDGFAPGTQG